MISTIFLCVAFVQFSAAFDCQVPPIYVDIHKRAVHGTEVFEYGTFIGLGTPAQNQSLWPSLLQNETTIADTNFCQNNLTCLDSTGGLFELDQSSTWKEDPNYESNDINVDPTSGSSGFDTLHIYTHFFEVDPATDTPIPNFPIHLLDNATFLPETPHLVTNGSSTPGTLGIGSKSTLLQALWARNQISSRSFGLYLGTGFDRAGGDINGSLALGGYDAGRFNGTVHNYTISTTSPTPADVHVSQIVLNDPNGEIRNLNLINDTGFDASITTEQYPLSLPADVTQAFAQALAAVPANNSDNSLQTTKPFNGTMTVTLSDGFSVSFPSEWVSNISSLSPIAAAPQGDSTSNTGPFFLGSSFLSQVYLMMNYDDDTFHLAQAIQEADFVITKTMCPKVVPQPYVYRRTNSFARNGLAGAIVGGIIGGSALSIGAACLILSWRRKRNAKQVHFFNGAKGGVKVTEFEIESDEEGNGKKLKKVRGQVKDKELGWGEGDHELRFWKKK